MMGSGSARVLLALDSSAAWSRGILRGFAQIAHEQGWTLLHYHPTADLERIAAELEPSAVVMGPTFAGPWPAKLRGRVSVAINANRCAEGVASVCVDAPAITDLAVSHLLDRGFRNLNSFSLDHWAAARERRFRDTARRLGALVEPRWQSDTAVAPYVEDPTAIMAWLARLRKPCGIFACCDAWARVVARYASAANLRVPEDVAVLGVDNDAFECEMSSPPLSSVAVPWRTLGENAARLVQLGLRGDAIAGRLVVVGPIDVVVRRSSDMFAIEDPLVAAAVTWIHEHCEKRCAVPTIARALGVSRQRLERHFRAGLGRTVLHEVRRTRVELARRLLSTTALPLTDIARRSGFTNPALLNVAFRREVGMPPGVYRRRTRETVEPET